MSSDAAYLESTETGEPNISLDSAYFEFYETSKHLEPAETA